MTNGLIAVIIVCIVIVGAIATKRCTEFLFLGSALGAIVLFGTHMPMEYIGILEEVVGDPDNVWLWLVCGLFGSLIALLQAAKGTLGFQKIIEKICINERRTMVASFILGILIFVDDYLNVLTVGVCMKGVYDKRKVPRESLAFVLDSTGAPVCVLLPFSTWAVFYANLFYSENAVAGSFSSGLSAYVHAIPFCFYPFLALFIVFLFCMGWFPKIGEMKKAYKRVEETGMLYSNASKKYNMNEEEYTGDGKVSDFLIPILLLIVVGIASGEILLGVVAAILICLILYVPRKLMSMEEFFNHMVEGFGSMLSIFFIFQNGQPFGKRNFGDAG